MLSFIYSAWLVLFIRNHANVPPSDFCTKLLDNWVYSGFPCVLVPEESWDLKTGGLEIQKNSACYIEWNPSFLGPHDSQRLVDPHRSTKLVGLRGGYHRWISGGIVVGCESPRTASGFGVVDKRIHEWDRNYTPLKSTIILKNGGSFWMMINLSGGS